MIITVTSLGLEIHFSITDSSILKRSWKVRDDLFVVKITLLNTCLTCYVALMKKKLLS